MQRSRAVHVLQTDVGAMMKKAADRLDLSFGIPCGTSDEAVCGVMQRGASAVILRRVRIGG
ncbi:MAG TPA: hypothetical protein VKM56_10845 [Verrucomicrobiae bacterium]|nr:hypothetical protein [Verrucomicrobiae bacterium]